MAGLSYIDRINAFWNRQLLKPVTPGAQSVYFAILHFANRAVWPDSVTVPLSSLLALTGMHKSELYRYRKELKNAGLIGVENGKKGQCAIYTLCSIVPAGGTNTGTNSGTNTGTNSGNIYRLKTKDKDGGEAPSDLQSWLETDDD